VMGGRRLWAQIFFLRRARGKMASSASDERAPGGRSPRRSARARVQLGIATRLRAAARGRPEGERQGGVFPQAERETAAPATVVRGARFESRRRLMIQQLRDAAGSGRGGRLRTRPPPWRCSIAHKRCVIGHRPMSSKQFVKLPQKAPLSLNLSAHQPHPLGPRRLRRQVKVGTGGGWQRPDAVRRRPRRRPPQCRSPSRRRRF
jgi:hypothetical protein